MSETSAAWVLYDGEPEYLPVGPLTRQAAMDREAERQGRLEERQRAEAKAQRAERREAMLFAAGMEWSAARGVPFDPLNPYVNLPTVEQQADWDEAREAAQVRAAAKRALSEAGLPLSLLKSALPEPRTDVPAFPEPSADELAEARLASARRRTDRAGIVAKCRRVLSRPVQQVKSTWRAA